MGQFSMMRAGLLAAALLVGCSEGSSPLSAAAARLLGDAEHLVDFGTRHALSEENVDVASWLADRFRQVGCDDVVLQDFVIEQDRLDDCTMDGELTRSNVVATIPGAAGGDQIVLVGAHFDSCTDPCDPQAPAPGADDNASGTAALLEIARALVADPPGRTVQLVAFNAEERPMHLGGSGSYINQAGDATADIAVVINLDMIGHPTDAERRSITIIYDPDGTRPENDDASQAWANRLYVHSAEAGLSPERDYRFILGFDCVPFEAAGVPCTGLFDGADAIEMIHTTADDASVLDAEYMALATEAALAVIREAADPDYTPPGIDD